MAILLGYFAIPALFMLHTYGSLLLGVLLHIPMVVDGYTQLKKWRESTNSLRIATGLLSGIGQLMIVVSISMAIADLL